MLLIFKKIKNRNHNNTVFLIDAKFSARTFYGKHIKNQNWYDRNI